MARRRTLFRGAAVVAVLALAATACGGGSSNGGNGGGGGNASAGDTTGVTDTSILIGSHQPLTGPAAPGYSEIAPASKAMFDYINDTDGGINGRKITYKYLDDGYNPTNTVTVVKQLVLQDKVFAIFTGLGTPTHEKVVDFLNQRGVPDLFVASGCLCWNQPKEHPETFGWQVDYYREGKILGNYIKQSMAGKKVAYLYQDDDFGQDGVKGLDKYVPADSVVSRQTYVTTNTDLAPALQKIQQAKADTLVCFCIPAFTALAKLNALKLGYNPQFVVSNVGSDPITLSGLLEEFASKGGAKVQGNQLIEGIITDGYLSSLGDTSNSWIQLFKKVHDKYIPNLPFDGNVEYGMATAYTFAAAVKAAGKDLTRESLVKAVETAKLAGPGLVPFAFSDTDHSGFTGTQIGIIKGGNIVLQGNPQTTDDADGPIKDYTQPQPKVGDGGLFTASS